MLAIALGLLVERAGSVWSRMLRTPVEPVWITPVCRACREAIHLGNDQRHGPCACFCA